MGRGTPPLMHRLLELCHEWRRCYKGPVSFDMIFSVLAWEVRPRKLLTHKNRYRGIKLALIDMDPSLRDILIFLKPGQKDGTEQA